MNIRTVIDNKADLKSRLEVAVHIIRLLIKERRDYKILKSKFDNLEKVASYNICKTYGIYFGLLKGGYSCEKCHDNICKKCSFDCSTFNGPKIYLCEECMAR